jgi:hypothetical protein
MNMGRSRGRSGGVCLGSTGTAVIAAAALVAGCGSSGQTQPAPIKTTTVASSNRVTAVSSAPRPTTRSSVRTAVRTTTVPKSTKTVPESTKKRTIPIRLTTVTTKVVTTHAAAQGAVDTHTAAARQSGTRRQTVHATSTPPRKIVKTEPATISREPNEGNRPGGLAKPGNPCGYVTAAEAASILHVGSVTKKEAPLGPTCVMSAPALKRTPTLAVETLDVGREVSHMKAETTTTIDGHRAYCGTLGTAILLVPVTKYSVLDINAPCAEAKALAAAALPRIET